MTLENLTKAKLYHLLGLLDNNEHEGEYYGNKAQYWNRHRELKSQIIAIIDDGVDKKPTRWECLLCGRNKFIKKSAHNCVSGYRKHNIEWKPIYE